MRILIASLTLFVTACGGSPNDGQGGGSGASGASTGGNSPSGGNTSAASGGSATTTGGSGGNSAAGGTFAAGGFAGKSGASGGGSSGATTASEQCDTLPAPGLPADAPAFGAGTWTDISPPGVPFNDDGTIALGLAVDRCNPATLYTTVTAYDPIADKGGVYKSTNAGASWNQVATVAPNFTGSDHLDNPIRIRIDPKDPQHLYVADGVRGGTTGFWVSTDAGESFVMPQSFSDLKDTENLYPFDVYDVAADPTDFNHILLTFHSAWGWTDTKWNTQSGVLESTDGGDSWIVHEPQDGWGTGNVINFLYQPELGIGDAQTWLFESPAGLWRTSDAGASWDKVSEIGVQHGGATTYYTQAGVLYSAGANQNLRSTDNGKSWNPIGPNKGFNAILGDGKHLFTAPCFGPTAFLVSDETDGDTWTDFNDQQFVQGPFELVSEPVNGMLYSASWGSGVWALKL
jgi:hypothetical protein